MNILIIVALNLILYVRTMKFLLVADDLSWWLKHKDGWLKFSQIRNIHTLRMWVFDRFYGGFTFNKNLSKIFLILLKKKYSKDDEERAQVRLEHLFTTAIHALICVMIYLAFGTNQVSFWAAILYSCNPINNQTAIWLNGRRYAINIILVLGMIMLAQQPFGWAYAGALYWLTSFFQVTAIFAPILLFYKYPWMLLIVPTILYFFGLEIITKIRDRYKIVYDLDRKSFTAKRFIIIVKVYGYYFFKMIFPGVCAMTYPTLYHWGQTKEGNKDAYAYNAEYFRGILAISICCYGIYFFISTGNYYLTGFLAFMCISLLQWCSIIPIVQDLADRYAGMPTVFAMFFFSYFVHQYAGQYAVPILAAFAGCYIPLLLNVMRMYRSEGSRWEYQRHWFPALPAPLKFEVEYLIHDRNDPARAWVLIQEYVKYGGRDFTILFQAAKCHQKVYKLDEARKFAELARQNYHLYKEEIEKDMIDTFLKGCVMPSGSIVGPVSRQVKRAEERKKDKRI